MADNDRVNFTDLQGFNIETDQTCADFSPKLKLNDKSLGL
jgi:hypothetical protein